MRVMEQQALQHEDVLPTVDDNINEAGVEDKNAGVDVPPTVDEVVLEEAQPEPLAVILPLEPELTLKPWLNPEAETTAARGTTNSPEEIITDVLLSMKKEDKGEEGNQDQQPGD
ncbi:hypothetical protein PIB30_045196 [Stylosanthes scabra]|uniref:Uncharacterized protein n=1 Tax=Stylosanthes scabra TaxID=79078 RepID=A0ABU6QFH9_9FABA|nr:hypothetical protein [Stylosanthes scabra]